MSATPTCDSAGHVRPVIRQLSQYGTACGLPRNPAGRSTMMLRGSSTGDGSAFAARKLLTQKLVVAANGCPPARVSSSPPASNAFALNKLAPNSKNGARVRVSASDALAAAPPPLIVAVAVRSSGADRSTRTAMRSGGNATPLAGTLVLVHCNGTTCVQDHPCADPTPFSLSTLAFRA